MIPTAPWLVVVALSTGCDRTPATIDACPDVACQRSWIERHIVSDPEATIAAVHALPAGVDRETLIQVVMVEWPEHSASLCPDLPEGPVRDRCQSLTDRPHLWQVDADTPETGRVGAGRAYPVLSVELGEFVHPWSSLEPLTVECKEDWTENTCVGQRAVEWAHKGRHQDAWRVCLAATQEKWRFECFFQISEASYDPLKGGVPGIAAEMCLESGYYLDRCLGHLAGRLGRTAPAATWDADPQWRELEATLVQIQGALEGYSPALASRFTALSWAYAMDAAYADVQRPVGNPMDSVGPAAVPHIAAAVAWTLWRAEGHKDQSLDAWIDAFENAMSRREVDPTPRPRLVEEVELAQSWDDTLPGEEQIDWTVYRGPIARRAVGMDPRTDALICVLEAAARNPTPHRSSLFREALRHPDALVRWTAARLAAQRLPGLANAVDPADESDPLVRARLEQAAATRDD